MPAESPNTSPVVCATEESTAPVSELLTAYRAAPSQLRAAVVGMTPDQLRARPVAGKLSTLEVICHLGDADQMMCDRMKRTVGTDLPLLIGVENIRYTDPLHYHERDLDLELDLFELGHRQMAADLERLPADAWERTAVHSEVGLVTLRQLLLHAICHVEGHLEAIAEKREALGIG